MKLSQEDNDRITKWLNDKCMPMRCTCCGMIPNNWAIAPFVTLPIAFNVHTTRFYYAEGIPQVNVVCSNCGHTLAFNTHVMGFKPDEPKAAPLAEEK